MLGWSQAVRAQTTGTRRRIGAAFGPNVALQAAFMAGLRDHGWIDGQNVTVDIRQSDDEIADLVRLGVDVLVLPNPYRMRAGMKLTRTIPIVGIDLESDPVANGFVKSLSRPGGNVTGIWLDIPEIASKQLQLLQQAVPGLRRIAVVWDEKIAAEQFAVIQSTARALGVTAHSVPLRDHRRPTDHIDAALRSMLVARPQAVLMLTAPIVLRNQARVGALALEHRLASMSGFTSFPDTGGLLAYGPDLTALWRQAADYVDRILKGTRPAELPVVRPGKFDLRINARTAKALGLTLPPSLLAGASEVLQ